MKESLPSDKQTSLYRLCECVSIHSPIPMVAIDGLTHLVVYANPSFSKLTGKDSVELIGIRFEDALDPTFTATFGNLLDQVFRTGKARSSDKQNQVLENSDSRLLDITAWPLVWKSECHKLMMVQVTEGSDCRNGQNKIVEMNQSLVMSSLQQLELTEVEQDLNTQLGAAIEAKNLFLATMSHEIRTPLNAIMGCCELLCLTDQTLEDKSDLESRIKRNARTLTRLIDDILDLSKMESGKLEIESVATNLVELISDIEANMRVLAKLKTIGFFLKFKSSLPVAILTDPNRLTQILSNIIGNAIKFTTNGSVSVEIDSDLVARKLRCTVRDSGIGINQVDGEKLFRPFTQIDSTNTRKFGGTGLGLDLARRLARTLGGDILLLESTPGVGSVFEITVGLELAILEPVLLTTSPHAPIADLSGLHILLAEDAPDNQFLIIEFLTMAGIKVQVAWNGLEAVQMALAFEFDAILMDIQMPELDGYEATAHLRASGCKSPIVALTAHAMSGEQERCRLAGCDDYLAKPVSMTKLLQTISKNVRGAEGREIQMELMQPLNSLH